MPVGAFFQIIIPFQFEITDISIKIQLMKR